MNLSVLAESVQGQATKCMTRASSKQTNTVPLHLLDSFWAQSLSQSYNPVCFLSAFYQLQTYLGQAWNHPAEIKRYVALDRAPDAKIWQDDSTRCGPQHFEGIQTGFDEDNGSANCQGVSLVILSRQGCPSTAQAAISYAAQFHRLPVAYKHLCNGFRRLQGRQWMSRRQVAPTEPVSR